MKDINPKDAVGSAKVPMSNVPAPVLMEVGIAMMEGARKYGRHNYRVADVKAAVYFDASLRHLFSWWEGEDIDPDSFVNHLSKAIATLAVLRDAQIRGKMVDNRPPGTAGFVKELNKMAAALVEKYPECKEEFVAGDTEPHPYGG